MTSLIDRWHDLLYSSFGVATTSTAPSISIYRQAIPYPTGRHPCHINLLLAFAFLLHKPTAFNIFVSSKQAKSTLKESRWAKMQSRQPDSICRFIIHFLQVTAGFCMEKMQGLQPSPISTACLWCSSVGVISTALKMAIILIYGFPSFSPWRAAQSPKDHMTSVCCFCSWDQREALSPVGEKKLPYSSWICNPTADATIDKEHQHS